ncbi:GEMI7 protein, partial [Pteruthius melanotis]|nr:GEMI7 protein [Pteruthius melanotis]
MADPLPLPVGILRLPRGPDSSGSRGFSARDSLRDRDRDRDHDDSRGDEHSQAFPGASPELQAARAALRERFLRLLGRARGRAARFSLRNGLGLRAVLAAADRESAAFQVDSLRTPLGIQGAALLRSSDVLAFSFPL